MTPRRGSARPALLALAALLAACNPRGPARGGNDGSAPGDLAQPAGTAGDAGGANSRPEGITHERLLQIYGYTDGGSDGGGSDGANANAEAQPAAPGTPLSPDTDFASDAPARTVRARYAINFPDERATIPTERALRVDDQGDRASITLVGTGMPAAPGMRVSARTALSGFVLVGADGTRYRTSAPDELSEWFTGAAPAPGTALAFRRTDNIVLVRRGQLSLSMLVERTGDVHPLTCRTLVALLLGGDPAATRLGCANARVPVRAILRARNTVAVDLERTEMNEVSVPRDTLAVPPAGASPDLPPPRRRPDGAFFAPSELAALGGVFRPESVLTVHNAMEREALVFVNDLAIGWVAAGHTAEFVGLPLGPHLVRGRSIDGLDRSHSTEVTLPGAVRFDPAPAFNRGP